MRGSSLAPLPPQPHLAGGQELCFQAKPLNHSSLRSDFGVIEMGFVEV